jgi:hypothetical protein
MYNKFLPINTTSIKFKKLFLFILFFLIFSIGFKSYKSYGIAWDEELQRRSGFIHLNYVAKKILSEQLYQKLYSYGFNNLLNSNDQKRIIENNEYNLDKKKYVELDLQKDLAGNKAYGPSFEITAIILEAAFKFKNEKEIYQFRHFINFLFYFFALIFFYKFLESKFKNFFLSIVGVLTLFFTPRIFVESFVNSKDIIFMSYFIITNYFGYKFYKNKKKKNFILFSLFCALSSSLRIIGFINIIAYALLIFFEKKNDYYDKFKNILFLGIASCFFYIIVTPVLWENTIDNIKYILNYSTNIPYVGEVFYFEKFIISNNLPWHYLPIWISITISELVIIIFIFSTILLFYQFIKKKIVNENIVYLIIFIFLPVMLKIILGSPIHNGWRHFFFIYPWIIVIYLSGIEYLFKLNKKYFFLLTALVTINFMNIAYWMFKNHPYQNLYFNNFLPNAIEKFEKDYHGLSNKQLIENLLLNKIKKEEIIYFDYIGSNFPSSLKILDLNDQKKFMYIGKNSNIKKYYLFLNDSNLSGRDKKNYKSKFIEKIELYDTYINGVMLIKK